MLNRVRLVFAAAILFGALPAFAQPPEVRFVTHDDRIDVNFGNRLFTSYRFYPDPAKPLVEPNVLMTKPVLYPVLSPSGLDMTRGYPFTRTPGESTDHPHHMGIFFAVDRVGGDENNFWNNSKGQFPAIHRLTVTPKSQGPGAGELDARSIWIGKKGVAILYEDRQMVFRYLDDSTSAIDFTITLTPAQGEVVFPDTKEGMFAIRVAEWLTEKAGGRYLNSDGQEMEAGVWGRRANWVRLQGETGGARAGIVILSHPSNPNSPTFWHARGYGCFSVNPLGQLDFESALKAPHPKAFNLTLQEGQKAVFKYRVVIYEGDVDQAKAQLLYENYLKQTAQ